MKELTKESIEEFKKLKKWVQECPIEAAMDIESLRVQHDFSVKWRNDLREKATLLENENRKLRAQIKKVKILVNSESDGNSVKEDLRLMLDEG